MLEDIVLSGSVESPDTPPGLRLESSTTHAPLRIGVNLRNINADPEYRGCKREFASRPPYVVDFKVPVQLIESTFAYAKGINPTQAIGKAHVLLLIKNFARCCVVNRSARTLHRGLHRRELSGRRE
ncbi:hypothetical protein LTR37_004640 [Vermiconidia calcicola]|uniref:Uncharacterized protein n=1 Tax=Vermiconidia calcicola TaxID=1690605 RepID=A0ACC3NP96_9PEZI|nr:hypothetical protein LTR37_004640 [Vermiconidia calcicola]